MIEHNKDYYDSHMEKLLVSLGEELEKGNVLRYLHDVKFGSNEKLKSALAPMMFLVDMKHDEANKWLNKAFEFFYENSAFDSLRNDPGMTSLRKCMLVKAYREIVKEKRKAKEDLTVTAEEMVGRIISWIKDA